MDLLKTVAEQSLKGIKKGRGRERKGRRKSRKRTREAEKNTTSRYCRNGEEAEQRLEGVVCGEESEHASHWEYQEKKSARETTGSCDRDGGTGKEMET